MSPLSNLTPWSEITAGSQATPGLWNERFSTLSQNIDQINSDVTGFSNISNQFFNVKNFGAVGDGVTDDTDAVQTTINSAVSQIVLIPPGVKYNRSSLTYNPGVVIIDGSKSVWQVSTMAPYFPPTSELEIIAHRGFSQQAPEHTIAAYTAAIGKADSVEFDIIVSADSVPVLIHDSTVDRTTDSTGTVEEMTLAELQALDAGSWFDSKFSGARIPTLEDGLKAVKGHFRYVYAELKGTRTKNDIQIIVDEIKRQGMEDRVVLHSFGTSDVSWVRGFGYRGPFGILVSKNDGISALTAAMDAAEADGNTVVMPEADLILDHPSSVSEGRLRGLDFVTWTVESTDSLRKLADIGITRIMSNKIVGRHL